MLAIISIIALLFNDLINSSYQLLWGPIRIVSLTAIISIDFKLQAFFVGCALDLDPAALCLA